MSKLKLIDERLKSLRATRQNKARDAEWCKDNRWRDEFKMDRERHHHLSTVALLGRVDKPDPDANARQQHEGCKALDQLVVSGGDAT